MNSQIILTFLFCVFAANAVQFTTVQNSDVCRRVVTESLTDNSFVFTSTRACKTGPKAAEATRIVFDINTINCPDMRCSMWKKNLGESNPTTALQTFRVYIERFIEYKDVDGIPGYQPAVGGDQPCYINFMANETWNPWTVTHQIDETTGDTAYIFTATSTNGIFTMQLYFATAVMQGGNNTYVVPHSAKLSFSVQNYVWHDQKCASGLAFRVFIFSASGTESKTDNDTDLPNTANTQGVNILTDDQALGAYWLWEEFMKLPNGSNLILYSKQLPIDSDLATVHSVIDTGFHANTIWYSFVGNQVTDFTWDPYFGTPDDNVSSASTICFSTTLIGFLLLSFCFLY